MELSELFSLTRGVSPHARLVYATLAGDPALATSVAGEGDCPPEVLEALTGFNRDVVLSCIEELAEARLLKWKKGGVRVELLHPVSRGNGRRRRPKDSGGGSGSRAAKDKYTPEFEALWADYPGRDGSNPKSDAFRAYCARLKEGIAHADMHEGVKRYARWCEANGSIRSRHVMQCKRFLGPADPPYFLSPWDHAGVASEVSVAAGAEDPDSVTDALMGGESS